MQNNSRKSFLNLFTGIRPDKNSKKFTSIILASLGVIFVLCLTLSPNPAYATIITCTPSPCIVYDYQSPPNTSAPNPPPSTWYFIGHGAVINITDASKNPEVQGQTIQATIQSFDTAGSLLGSFNFPLTYLPDPVNPDTFQSPWINFTSGSIDATNYKLHVVIGGTVTVTYTNTATPPQTAQSQSARIIDSTELYPIPTSGMPAQPVQSYKAPACTDTDSDFICDSWEDQTAHPGFLQIPYTYSGQNYLYTMYCGTSGPGFTAHQNNPNAPYDPVCPSTNHKDVYVEVDWMKRHQPDPRALTNVTNAFANNGVTLHIQLGNEVPHYSDTTSPPAQGASTLSSQWTDFDKIKRWWFGTSYERGCTTSTGTLSGSTLQSGTPCYNAIVGNLTAKRQVFHYVLFAHFYGADPYSSGRSEQLGNDVGIYLGHFTAAVGSLDEQQGSFMHELGHNLNLYHGGQTPPDGANPEWDNCKPNYLSVMSYTRQFAESYPINRALNYSSGWLSQLDKNSLNECVGVTSTTNTGQQMVYANPPNNSYKISTITNNIDWNANTILQGSTCPSPNNANIKADINNFSAAIKVCNPPDPGHASAADNVLKDYNDWGNLNFNLRTNSNFNDGAPPDPTVSPPAKEITINDVTGIRVSRVMDLYPLVDPSLRPAVNSIVNDVEQKDLYSATTGLIELRQLIKTPQQFSILDGILNSFKIANTVAYSSKDQTPLVTCEEKWENIPPYQQRQIISYEQVQTYLPHDYITGLIIWLHTDGCTVPKSITCINGYVQMTTNTGMPVCVKKITSDILLKLNINWTLTKIIQPTPLPLQPPKCLFGINPDGTCKQPLPHVSNSTGTTKSTS